MTALAGCLVAVLLAPVIVACSSDSESDDPTTDTSADSTVPATASDEGLAAQQDALKDAVVAYSDAFLAGQSDDAWALLSSRCRDRLSEPEFDSLVEQGAAQYGDASLESLEVTSFAGELARVSYTYSESVINQTDEPWGFEDGAWRNDDC